MSNDIELNPGPRPPKYPCDSCGKAVKNNQNGIQCDKCSTWHHIECQGMGIEVHKVWDPNHKDKTKQIEAVQRRAARWTVCNFDRTSSVSAMVETLGWRTLEQRRADARLCLFYKIINNLVAVPLPDYVQPNTRPSRRGHSMTFCQLYTPTDYYKYFFSPS